jgi:flagellar protein FlbD
MTQLTRLNNTRLALNSDLIKYVEQAPDTVITLLNGEKLVVRESTEQVIERVLDFRRSVLVASPDGPLPCEDSGSGPVQSSLAPGEGQRHG